MSLLVFMTLSFTAIIAGFNLVVSSFNGRFSRQVRFMQPHYYVTARQELDLDVPNYGFKDQSFDKHSQEIAREVFTGMRIYEGIIIPGLLAIKGQKSRDKEILAVGIDFEKAREMFPSIAEEYSQDQMLQFKESRIMLVEEYFSEKAGYVPNQEVILLTDNYHRSLNGIKMKTVPLRTPFTESEFFSDFGIVWIDMSSLALVGAMPKGREWPLFVFSDRPVISPLTSWREIGLNKSLNAIDASFVTPLTSMQEMRSSFEILVVFFITLGIVIVFIVIVSASSNMFINFQNRKAEFGLMKAFGFRNQDFFWFVFTENLMLISIAIFIAFTVNLIISSTVPSFSIDDFPSNLSVSWFSVNVMLLVAFIINVFSIVRPFLYLRQIDPINIMREE